MIKYTEENSMLERTEQTIEAMDTSGKEPQMPGCMVRGPRGATPTGEEEPMAKRLTPPVRVPTPVPVTMQYPKTS